MNDHVKIALLLLSNKRTVTSVISLCIQFPKSGTYLAKSGTYLAGGTFQIICLILSTCEKLNVVLNEPADYYNCKHVILNCYHFAAMFKKCISYK